MLSDTLNRSQFGSWPAGRVGCGGKCVRVGKGRVPVGTGRVNDPVGRGGRVPVPVGRGPCDVLNCAIETPTTVASTSESIESRSMLLLLLTLHAREMNPSDFRNLRDVAVLWKDLVKVCVLFIQEKSYNFREHQRQIHDEPRT